MTWALALLLCASPADDLKKADKLAVAARSAEGEQRKRAVAKALDAYAALIRERPKDRRWVPRIRRKRASLLKGEGRIPEALAEHDRIYAGRSRRRDRARALYDGARLLPPEQSEKRFRRVLKEFSDVTSQCAKAALERGKALEKLGRSAEAERAYRYVTERCRDEAKQAVEAYDRLALLEIARGRAKEAQRWLRACVRRYIKRASRGDRYGAFLSRLLGDMKAPKRLTEALAEPVPGGAQGGGDGG